MVLFPFKVHLDNFSYKHLPCMDGLVISKSTHAVGLGLAPQLGFTKNHNKNGTKCLTAWHAGIREGERISQCSPTVVKAG